jgi:glycosyltransferase involved in cell wall biosynthesis
MSIKAQTVALVDWNWAGHHPMQFANFTMALEELGADVLGLCPNPEEARNNTDALRRWRGLDETGQGQTAYRKVLRPAVRFHRFRPSRIWDRIGAIDWTIRHFRGVESAVNQWQAESGKRVDSLFYACIYDWDFQWFQFAQPFLRLPWSGLYLHAQSFRMPGQPNPQTGRLPCPEKIFRGRGCKGLAIFDKAIASRVSATTGKPVLVFPDLTDDRLPTDPRDQVLANSLKRFSDGRPVVGLFGYLKPSKGLLPLLQASTDPRLEHVCFAIAGEMHWAAFSQQNTQTICDILGSGFNTWSHLMRVPREEQLNALLSACDILCAVYCDFPHSSGIVTKAAAFEKPLVVSDGYLMAEQVRAFGMGEVVPQGNVDAIVSAILKITIGPKAWVEQNQPRWSDYMREHSFDRLKEAFHELLAQGS